MPQPWWQPALAGGALGASDLAAPGLGELLSSGSIAAKGGDAGPSRADQNARLASTVDARTSSSVSVGGISAPFNVNTAPFGSAGGLPVWALGLAAVLGIGYFAWRHRS